MKWNDNDLADLSKLPILSEEIVSRHPNFRELRDKDGIRKINDPFWLEGVNWALVRVCLVAIENTSSEAGWNAICNAILIDGKFPPWWEELILKSNELKKQRMVWNLKKTKQPKWNSLFEGEEYVHK